jgi:ERCC4-related helicase
MFRCRAFIGQGAAGKGPRKAGQLAGQKGMTQQEQKKVLSDFRAGEFNVLVATCIAEEGLDIPQVGRWAR